MNRKWEKVSGMDSCMCGYLVWKGFEFDVHCHRSSCKHCQYGGVHIDTYPKGTFKESVRIATRMAKELSKTWFTEVEVYKKNEKDI